MLQKLITFLLLFICSHCLNVFTPVALEKSNFTELNTTLNATTYFYITISASDIGGTVYFEIEDNNYHLNYDRIKVCYTTHNPTEDSTLSDCSWDSITTYEQKTDTENKQYFYQYTYYPYIYSRNVLVQYTGTNPDGKLGAKASLSDIFDKVKDILDSTLSVLAIIGIVIGSIIGFMLFLGAVCAIIACCLEKHNKGGLSINTKTTTDIEIPLAS